jgi:hypothetical protein
LICFARVTLGLGKCTMAEHGHDFIGTASGLCEPPTGSLAQPMGLAFERQVGGPDCCAHPLAETINRERLSVVGVDREFVLKTAAGEVRSATPPRKQDA